MPASEEQRKLPERLPWAPIYRRTGNLRAAQPLLGHTKLESAAQYPRVEGAFAIAEQTDIPARWRAAVAAAHAPFRTLGLPVRKFSSGMRRWNAKGIPPCAR
jgi:hypothetical protein